MIICPNVQYDQVYTSGERFCKSFVYIHSCRHPHESPQTYSFIQALTSHFISIKNRPWSHRYWHGIVNHVCLHYLAPLDPFEWWYKRTMHALSFLHSQTLHINVSSSKLLLQTKKSKVILVGTQERKSGLYTYITFGLYSETWYSCVLS